MYCPKCGTGNEENTRYCRTCGEDLGVISRVLQGGVSFQVAQKIDTVLATRRNNDLFSYQWLKDQKKRAMGQVGCGVVSLLALYWFAYLGNGSPDFIYGLLATIACYLMVIGLYDYRRSHRLASTASASDAPVQADRPLPRPPENFSRSLPAHGQRLRPASPTERRVTSSRQPTG